MDHEQSLSPPSSPSASLSLQSLTASSMALHQQLQHQQQLQIQHHQMQMQQYHQQQQQLQQQQQQQQQQQLQQQGLQQKMKPRIKGIDESIATQQIIEEDEEDIWPEEVEKCFQEALVAYPPIGRRKLLENGKMFGRNELIAKYIFEKTGKIRTRKQVSSHIQVLGKKQKKFTDPPQPKTPYHRSSYSSSHNNSQYSMQPHSSRAQVDFPGSRQGEGRQAQGFNALGQNLQAFNASSSSAPFNFQAQSQSSLPHFMQSQDEYALKSFPPLSPLSGIPSLPNFTSHDLYNSPTSPVSPRNLPVFLKHFWAYLEYPNASLTGMVNRHHYVTLNDTDFDNCAEEVTLDQVESKYFGLKELYERSTIPCFFLAKCVGNASNQENAGVHSLYVKYESKHRMTLKCSTTVYSFGRAVVEKIQVEDPVLEYGTYNYFFSHSPICQYMEQFVIKLKGLNDVEKMNRVLQNFSVLQVILDTSTNTTLLCTAFIFEVSDDPNNMGNKVMRIVPTRA